MSTPICERMERWLDDGRPRDGASTADARELEAHAATCPRCGPALAAAVALDSALRAPPGVRAPAGLAADVMARIAAEAPTASGAGATTEAPPRTPWWTLVLSEPWTLAGASGVVAIVSGRDRLVALARTLTASFPEPAGWTPPPWLDQALALAPHAQTAVALGAAAAAGAFGWLLFRFSEALFVRAAR